MRAVVFPPTFAGWRDAARALLAESVSPDAVHWQPETDEQAALLAGPLPPTPSPQNSRGEGESGGVGRG